MAVRISLGVALGFLGILLFGVAGANASADLPAGQHSNSGTDQGTFRSDHGNQRSDHSRVIQRTVALTGKLVHGRADAVTDTVGKTTEKIRPSQTVTKPQEKSAPAASTFTQQALEKAETRQTVTPKGPKSATTEALPPAATHDVQKTSPEARPLKATQKLKATAAEVASELKTSTTQKAAPKAATKPVRTTTTAVGNELKKTTKKLGTQTNSATPKRSGTVASTPRERPNRNAVAQVSDTLDRPIAKARETSGTLVKGVPLDRTIDAVVDLPSELAEPPVKETLSTVTTSLDEAVSQVPIVNKVLPKHVLTRTTKPVADLADGTIDAVVTPVLTPVAHVADPVVKPMAGAVEPVVGGVAGTVDAIIAPVADIAVPVLVPIVGVVDPVLGGVADTVGPILVPVADAVAPVVDTAGTVLGFIEPALDPTVRTRAGSATQTSASSVLVEDRNLVRIDNGAAVTTAVWTPALADRVPGVEAVELAAPVTEAAQLVRSTQPWSTSGPAAATASGEADGKTPGPQHTPAPLAAQGPSTSFGSGGGPQVPLGAFENSPFGFVLNTVSDPTSETSNQGPRGTSDDPGSTPD